MLIAFFQTGCRKDDLLRNTKDGNPVGVRDFFSKNADASPQVQRVMNELQRQNNINGNSLVKSITSKHGYARWDKASMQIIKSKYATSFSKMAGEGKDTVVIVPLVKEGDEQVEAYLEAYLTDEVKIGVRTAGEYKKYLSSKNASEKDNAERAAVMFMSLTRDVFGYKNFKVIDKRLFHPNSDYSDTSTHDVEITLKKSQAISLRSTEECIIINTYLVVKQTCGTIISSELISSEIVCYVTIYDNGNGGSGGTSFPGDGGGGTGGGGTGTGGTGDPCSGNGLITNGILPPDPCNPGGGDGGGWIPFEDEYLESRIAELRSILLINPQALLPCDSLNMMPFDRYGPMWQSLAQFKPSQYIMYRIDSIRSVAPNWSVDNFNIQSLKDAYGGIVNCDFFPVRITQMPSGYTPETLLEYFRTHMNNFIDPNLNSSFSPYMDGSFNDLLKYAAPFEESIGALWSLKLGSWYVPGIDGSVIESGYSRYNSAGYQTHHYTFSTMETPLDFEHPVGGNRRFGIYSDPNHPGEYVFYTMGVDRIWDGSFAFGDWLKKQATGQNGFSNADSLWTSFQNGMIKFIQNHTGSATFYSNHNTIARPHWTDVEDYLKGYIDFGELKRGLGC